jgi:hypothetical protein
MTSLDDDKVGRERMNIREQVIYPSFPVKNALPMRDLHDEHATGCVEKLFTCQAD